jgi:ADP-heptose:LPS heptosyltransferase
MKEESLRILVIRFSSMGDIVLTSALIRQIKIKYPNAKIYFAVSKEFSEILEYNPRIDRVIEYSKEASINQIVNLKNNLRREFNDGKFDYVIDLQHNLRSQIFRSGLGKRYLLMNKRRLHKLSLVYLKKPLFKGIIPIPEIYRFTASELGIEDDGLGLEIWMENEKGLSYYPPAENKINDTKSLKIGIAPGAYHNTKRWQESNYIKLINELKSSVKAEIMLIGGIKDTDITDEIKNQISGDFDDATNSNSILRTVKKIDECSMLISNDTGVVHIAASRNIPVVAIYGSTVKDFGFIPYRVKSVIVEKEIPCRPCTHIGRDKCPQKHFDCMNKITVNDVMNAVEDLIGQIKA